MSKSAELLKSKNLRATHHRVHILDMILNYGSAIPYSHLQNNAKQMDRVTLYRILDSFIASGVIHKAYSDQHDSYLAVCNHQCSKQEHNHQHIHFKCSECDTVSCVEIDMNFQIAIPNAQVHSFSINADGLCAMCVQYN